MDEMDYLLGGFIWLFYYMGDFVGKVNKLRFF